MEAWNMLLVCEWNVMRNRENVCTATHPAVLLCVFSFVLGLYREAGRVPQAIKSLFQELQRCCTLLSSALKNSTGGEEWRMVGGVGGVGGGWVGAGEGEEVGRRGQGLERTRQPAGMWHVECTERDGVKEAGANEWDPIVVVARCTWRGQVLLERSCQSLHFQNNAPHDSCSAN